MSLYSRADVARELEASKDILVALHCTSPISHAINILFSHVEHLTEDAEKVRAIALDLYATTTGPAVARAKS